MANEFKHKDPCTTLTQCEYIGADGTGHVFASQATGDLLYADSATVLNRLARACSGSQMLQIASCKPAWTATPSLGTTSWCNMNHAHAAANSGGTVCANVLAGTTLKSCVVTSSLTSVGTLGALTVDDVAINGKVVTMTGSACDTIVMTAATNGAFSLVTTDTAAAAANIVITADGTVDINSAGLLTLDSGAAINIEPAACSAILLDGTISIDGAAITGATSILATDIKIGEDDQTKIDFADANIINLHANNIKALSVHNTSSKGELRFYEGCNYVGFAAPALSADQVWTLPTADGSSGQVLSTDSCGVLSWASAGGARSVAGDTDNGVMTWVTSDNTFAAEAALTYDGEHLTIGDGNLIIGTAGHGIDFSAQTQSTAYTASAEVLNHYEEGTWTPVIMDDNLDGTGESQTYNTQVARYTRIGSRVFIQTNLHINSIGTLTTSHTGRIGGLPFASNSTTGRSSSMAMGRTGGLSVTAGHAQGAVINENVSYMTLHNFDATAGSSGLLISEIGSDGNFTISGHYEI
jgi:hypothetical protein